MHRLSPPSWITLFPFVLFVDLPRGFLFLAFVDNPLDWFQASRAPAPHDGADHTRVKQVLFQVSPAPATTTVRITQRKNSRSSMKTNHQWTRINTNRPEDRWTSFNDNWRQNASALLSRWCDPVMGGSPPGSAGVPPAQILPQLQPSPPPQSTGSGALPLLRPGPCGSRRQGGRLQHRRETERQPKGQHAGGTPALPGVSSRW